MWTEIQSSPTSFASTSGQGIYEFSRQPGMSTSHCGRSYTDVVWNETDIWTNEPGVTDLSCRSLVSNMSWISRVKYSEAV